MVAGLPHVGALSLALLALACSRLSMQGKHACESNADCQGGRQCVQHVCQDPTVAAEVPCGPDLPPCGSGLTCCGARCVAYTPARWPERPQVPDARDSESPIVLAVTELVPGMDDDAEWRDVGFDLDCRATQRDGRDRSCSPVVDRDAGDLYEDGANGRDNGFGRSLGVALAFLAQRYAMPKTSTNAAIEDERGTLMVELTGYSGLLNDPDVGVRLSPSPGRTEEGWMLLAPEALPDRGFEFDEAYVVDGVVVAKASVLDFVMLLAFRPEYPETPRLVSFIDTTLYQVVLTLNLADYLKKDDPQNSSPSVHGELGAVWRRAELFRSLTETLYDVGICPDDPDSGYALVLDKAEEALDIRVEPDVAALPAERPALETCQAASFGITFEAWEAKFDWVGPGDAEPVFESSCACAARQTGLGGLPPKRCWSSVTEADSIGAGGSGSAP